ncbi:unnamed protein product [Nippostrongylus brasiliensis]|uniref:ACT domain-containing protein n=1 Tax=Nippostrongylus brasiliensis TaxID=27835 RepID=A0A0N4XIV1_NIPBR|nr:unnamed protein product [Nippostrongylus brasiliensis]
MSFAGNVSIKADISCDADVLSFLFAEEVGVLLEIEEHLMAKVIDELGGETDVLIVVSVNGDEVISEDLVTLREVWEGTSDRLGLMQTNAVCIEEAKQVRAVTKTVQYSAPFHWQEPEVLLHPQRHLNSGPRVAIIREEGSNGDREMAAAFAMVGFEPHDVTMTDLLAGHTLQVVAFVGGFSYADVLGSAKGWSVISFCLRNGHYLKVPTQRTEVGSKI